MVIFKVLSLFLNLSNFENNCNQLKIMSTPHWNQIYAQKLQQKKVFLINIIINKLKVLGNINQIPGLGRLFRFFVEFIKILITSHFYITNLFAFSKFYNINLDISKVWLFNKKNLWLNRDVFAFLDKRKIRYHISFTFKKRSWHKKNPPTTILREYALIQKNSVWRYR